MGFFDTIEKLQNTWPECRLQETISDPVIQAEATVNQPELGAKKKAAGRPEELSFLPLCQACGGRVFVFTDSGSLSCSACQPEATGQPVKLTGPGRPQSHPDLQVGSEYSATSATTGDSFSPEHRDHLESARAKENFAAAWPWIKEHLPQLLAAGWTRSALFCRGKLRHPVGNWGIAWLSVWRRSMLTVEINSRGAIVFIFEICGRRITQAAYPR